MLPKDWKFEFSIIINQKKLIRRWDSERELSLRRYRTRTTKYNRLVHKFCKRSTRLCVGTHVYQIQWNNAMQRPRRSRSFKVTDFWTNRKLIYDFLLVININLPTKGGYLEIHSSATGSQCRWRRAVSLAGSGRESQLRTYFSVFREQETLLQGGGGGCRYRSISVKQDLKIETILRVNFKKTLFLECYDTQSNSLVRPWWSSPASSLTEPYTIISQISHHVSVAPR